MTTAHDIRVERSRKRVRILLAGELVADTTGPLLVWEVPYYPTYYIPAADVRAKLVPAGADTARATWRGRGADRRGARRGDR